MAAALRAAEGGVFFPKSSGGVIFKIFPARGYTPYPSYSRPLLFSYLKTKLTKCALNGRIGWALNREIIESFNQLLNLFNTESDEEFDSFD